AATPAADAPLAAAARSMRASRRVRGATGRGVGAFAESGEPDEEPAGEPDDELSEVGGFAGRAPVEAPPGLAVEGPSAEPVGGAGAGRLWAGADRMRRCVTGRPRAASSTRRRWRRCRPGIWGGRRRGVDDLRRENRGRSHSVRACQGETLASCLLLNDSLLVH